MCGIAGIISPNPDLRGRVAAMTAALAHRGPDDAGTLEIGIAALGHRRLSILDPEHGAQPMSSASDELHIVFNGEIYNFPELRAELERQGATFRTNCDTEVILGLYQRLGAACVHCLRGMFAFAIWDARRQRLFAARDRLGQKSLFYTRLPGGGIAFASEIKALLAADLVPPGLDVQALYHYASLRYIPDDRTLFAGVAKLPAAHTLVWDGGEPGVERYWSLSFLDKLDAPESGILEELDHRLRDAVRAHALADVPVGAFLSGGIDSSLVTAMLAEHSPQSIDTFSIGVKEHEFNELPYARQAAERWHTRHHEAVVSADLLHLLPRMVWHMDELSDPFGIGVYLVGRLASRNVKVVLTGDGGDELFAGYDRFANTHLIDLYALLPARFRRTVMRDLGRRVPDSYGYKSVAQKVQWLNELSLCRGGERYALSLSFLRFTEDAKRELFNPTVLASLPEPDSATKILEHFNSDCVEDAIDRMLFTDQMTRLPDHILVVVDRMTMAHGVEARPPMLDHEFVEFAARIPGHLKLKRNTLKYPLRATARKYLPDALVHRTKQGFGFPIARWMRTDFHMLLRGVFAESRMVRSGIFRRAYIDALLEEHLSGRSDHNFRLWILLNAEIFHRLYLDRWSVDDVDEWLQERYTA